MPLNAPRDLLLHDLGAMYTAVKAASEMLASLANGAEDESLKNGLKSHAQETREQLSNLERCFSFLGAAPEARPNPVIEGFQAEHQAILAQEPSPRVLTLFNASAAASLAHFEIACYHGLIGQAAALGEQKVVELLEKNMKQERQALFTLDACAKELGMTPDILKAPPELV